MSRINTKYRILFQASFASHPVEICLSPFSTYDIANEFHGLAFSFLVNLMNGGPLSLKRKVSLTKHKYSLICETGSSCLSLPDVQLPTKSQMNFMDKLKAFLLT